MEIEQKYERKMRALRDELDLRRKTELHEVEERKNMQVNTLMRNHEKAFSDIKNYYNDITLNNLALINTLKVLVGSEMWFKHSISLYTLLVLLPLLLILAKPAIFPSLFYVRLTISERKILKIVNAICTFYRVDQSGEWLMSLVMI